MTKRFKHYSIAINNRNFEVCGQVHFASGRLATYDDIQYDYRYTYSHIDSAYDRPSSYKRSIWFDWCDWFKSIDNADWRIVSKNCHFFTIGGKVEYSDSETGELKAYVLIITASHNRAYEIMPS